MAATKIVPKGPRANREEGEFDRADILRRLFALPLPPTDWHRQYPTTTPLGRIMALRKLKVRDVDAMPGCPNYRVLSDYLADRKPIPQHHREVLARALDVDPRIF